MRVGDWKADVGREEDILLCLGLRPCSTIKVSVKATADKFNCLILSLTLSGLSTDSPASASKVLPRPALDAHF